MVSGGDAKDGYLILKNGEATIGIFTGTPRSLELWRQYTEEFVAEHSGG